jgi:hypothetical protein
MEPFLTGFADELVKVAARKGLKLFRELFARGEFEKAHQLAKEPGVFKPVGRPKMIREGKKTLERKRSPGHEVKHLGSGQEYAATAVADPRFGLAVRKTRHKKAVTPGESPARRQAVLEELKSSGSDAAPEFLGSFSAGPAGRQVEFHRFAPGVPVEKAIRRHGREAEEIAAAAARAQREVAAAGRKLGITVTDMTSKGNTLVHKTPRGWKASVIDFTATRGAPRTTGGPTHIQPPSPAATAKETFRPTDLDVAAYRRRLREARGEAKKHLAGLGDFMAAAKGTPKKVDAAAKARSDAITAFLAAKRGG